jgi:hypothetical protein
VLKNAIDYLHAEWSNKAAGFGHHTAQILERVNDVKHRGRGYDPACARRRTLTDVLTELAYRDVLVAFCRAVDDGRPDDAARLFTENCSVELGGPPVTGRESVRSALAGRPSGRRTPHTGTTTVQVTGPDSATASSVIVTVSTDNRDHEG